MTEGKGSVVDGEEAVEASHLSRGDGSKRTQPAEANAQSLSPLVELTSMRMREFLREKEAVFWVFVFPVLMTFALGIAFRNTAPDNTFVAVEADITNSRV